jgi:hypothetical protein
MDPVLHELSVAPSVAATQDRLRTLALTLQSLDGVGLARVLRRTRDALDRCVEGEVPLREALLKHPHREQRSFLLNRLSRAPFVEDMHRDQEDAARSMIEGAIGGVGCRGAVFAYLTHAPAVSLSGEDAWETDALVVALTRMRTEAPPGDEATTDAPLETEDVEVLQVATPTHVTRSEKHLRERVLRAVSTGKELWGLRSDLFPRLDFGLDVEEQLAALSDADLGFNHVVDALARLDASLRAWVDGPLEPGMKFSPESASTLNDSTYGPRRDFRCADGQTLRFSLHLKLFAGNRRIYYAPRRFEGEGRAHVGYVGPHLATTKYPT